MDGFERTKTGKPARKGSWKTFRKDVAAEVKQRPISAAKQRNLIIKAIDQHSAAHPRVAMELRRALLPRGARHLLIVNPDSQNRWLGHLAAGTDLVRPNLADAQKLTGIHMEWHVDAKASAAWAKADVDRHLDQIRRQIQRRFRGWNYVVTIEIAYHAVSPAHQHCWHAEGLGWGSGLDQKAHQQFSGGLHDSDGLWLEPVYDLPGALRYMSKMDLRAHRHRHRAYRGSKHDTRDLSNAELFGMISVCRHLTWPQVTVAGGEGREILRIALKRARWDV